MVGQKACTVVKTQVSINSASRQTQVTVPHLGRLDWAVTVHPDNVVAFVSRYRKQLRQPSRWGKELCQHLLNVKSEETRREKTEEKKAKDWPDKRRKQCIYLPVRLKHNGAIARMAGQVGLKNPNFRPAFPVGARNFARTFSAPRQE